MKKFFINDETKILHRILKIILISLAFAFVANAIIFSFILLVTGLISTFEHGFYNWGLLGIFSYALLSLSVTVKIIKYKVRIINFIQQYMYL